jgi:cobalt-zinc-cadmium efflux system membrane fusion protein
MNRLISIIFLIFIVACHNSADNNQKAYGGNSGRMERHRKRMRHSDPPEVFANILTKGDTVIVPPASPVTANLTMFTVDNQGYDAEFTTTGVVKPLTGHKAEVASPFGGRIIKSFVRLGQKIDTGNPLFEVSSSDYLEYVKMFLQAKRERELAEKNYKRKKDLLETGVSSNKEFDEAKLEFDLADKEYEKAEAMLKILNLNPEDADLAHPLIVKSPITGEIVDIDITVGQYIKSDAAPIVTIADIDKIWVVANVKEKDLGSISLNDQVEIISEVKPDLAVRGTVNYIGDILNQSTRSVEVYIECQNSSHYLKCGMFVTVHFYHELANAIIIPASSALQDDNKTYLFVKTGDRMYVKRQIKASSIPDDKLIVHSGLQKGDIIVSEGSIYLR